MLVFFLLNPTNDRCFNSPTSVPYFWLCPIHFLAALSPNLSIFSVVWYSWVSWTPWRGEEGDYGDGVMGRMRKLWKNSWYTVKSLAWDPFIVPTGNLERWAAKVIKLAMDSNIIQNNQPKAQSRKLQKDGIMLAGWWDGRWDPVLMNAKQCTQEKIALTKHTQQQALNQLLPLRKEMLHSLWIIF